MSVSFEIERVMDLLVKDKLFGPTVLYDNLKLQRSAVLTAVQWYISV